MTNQAYALAFGVTSFLFSLIFFRQLISAVVESGKKSERRKLVEGLALSRKTLNAQSKTALNSIDQKIELFGKNLVGNEYKERLKNLAIQTGGDGEGLFDIVIKQKIYFAIVGMIFSFVFGIKGNWAFVAVAGVFSILGYSLPSALKFVNKLVHSSYFGRLFSMARFAGDKWQNKEKLVGLKLLCSLLGFVVAYFYAAINSDTLNLIIWTLAGVSVGFFLPDVILYNKVAKRREKFGQTLPDAIDLLSMCVTAGLAFPAALAKVSDVQTGPVPEEFMRVRAEVQLGKDRNEALREMAERIQLESLRRFVNAVAQVDRFGIPISAALNEQARDLRAERQARAREKAQKVPIKILGPVMLCFLPCVVLIVLGPAVIGILGVL